MNENKIDYRQYLSLISDIKSNWQGGEKAEYLAMDYVARKIYERFIVGRNCTEEELKDG